MTKSRSLVEIFSPASRPFSPLSTRLVLRLACFMTMSCCTISSSSASRKLASFVASSDVYSLRKLRSVGTGTCACTSERNSDRCRWAGSVGGSST